MDSIQKLDANILPPSEQFANKLLHNETGCKATDYAHAQKEWDLFNCKSMKDYLLLYLKTDVLLLADVFEAFRNVCVKNYELDAAHYVSAPNLSWDAMLKLTNAKLELLCDPAMYKLFDDGIRGGLSMISTRFERANNPLLADYDEKKPTSYLIYLDMNNLYGWAMSQPMPMNGFRFLPRNEYDTINWLTQ